MPTLLTHNGYFTPPVGCGEFLGDFEIFPDGFPDVFKCLFLGLTLRCATR